MWGQDYTVLAMGPGTRRTDLCVIHCVVQRRVCVVGLGGGLYHPRAMLRLRCNRGVLLVLLVLALLVLLLL